MRKFCLLRHPGRVVRRLGRFGRPLCPPPGLSDSACAVHGRQRARRFWPPRMETNRKVTCGTTSEVRGDRPHRKLRQGRRADAGRFRGIPFDDSDVYKVIEGAAYTLGVQPDPKLEKYLDDLIAKIAAAQEPDGYLYTARRLLHPKRCPACRARRAGSQQGSAAMNSTMPATSMKRPWPITRPPASGPCSRWAARNADLLCRTFGPGKHPEPPGHEEIEIGLGKLYRATGDRSISTWPSS